MTEPVTHTVLRTKVGDAEELVPPPQEVPLESAASQSTAKKPAKNLYLRLGLLAAVVLLLLWAGLSSGVLNDKRAALEKLRTFMHDSGPLGFVLFILMFLLISPMQIPAFIFNGAAILAYGPLVGGLAAFLGLLFGANVVFFLARSIGGGALDNLNKPWIRRALSNLDERPVRTIVFLRIVLLNVPQLNYVFGLSNVRFRPFVIGSAVGIFPHVLFQTIFFDRLIEWSL